MQANITLKQRHAKDGRIKTWIKRILSVPLGLVIHLGHRYLTNYMLVGIETAVEYYLGLIHSPQVSTGLCLLCSASALLCPKCWPAALAARLCPRSAQTACAPPGGCLKLDCLARRCRCCVITT